MGDLSDELAELENELNNNPEVMFHYPPNIHSIKALETDIQILKILFKNEILTQDEVKEKVGLIQQKMNVLRTEKEVNKQLYAANIIKYIAAEERNLTEVSKHPGYADK